jgi:hypothetical protein
MQAPRGLPGPEAHGSIMASKRERKRKPRRSNSHSGDRRHFTPSVKHDRDLRWYFSHGKNRTSQWTTPDERQRWNRIHRCLDGKGYWLMLHYTGTGDRPIPALLRRDYRRYHHNTTKPYGKAHWPLYAIVEAERLLALLNRAKPRFLVRSTRDRWTDRSYLATEANTTNFFTDRDIHRFLEEGLVETSTWDDLRVDADAARFFLDIGCGIYRRLRDSEALEMLTRELASVALPKAPPWSLEPEPEEPEHTWRNGQRNALTEVADRIDAEANRLRGTRRGQDAVEFANYFALEAKWDPLKTEHEPTRPTTTVSEIAKRAELSTRWVRAHLVRLACP